MEPVTVAFFVGWVVALLMIGPVAFYAGQADIEYKLGKDLDQKQCEFCYTNGLPKVCKVCGCGPNDTTEPVPAPFSNMKGGGNGTAA